MWETNVIYFSKIRRTVSPCLVRERPSFCSSFRAFLHPSPHHTSSSIPPSFLERVKDSLCALPPPPPVCIGGGSTQQWKSKGGGGGGGMVTSSSAAASVSLRKKRGKVFFFLLSSFLFLHYVRAERAPPFPFCVGEGRDSPYTKPK